MALTAGVIFPAAVQAFVVTPAQSKLERPYIDRNIEATRAAMNISGVAQQDFAGNNDLNAVEVNQYRSTLDNVPLWDPTITQATFRKLQQNGAGFTLGGLSSDRYHLKGALTPVVAACGRSPRPTSPTSPG